ncbi:MAG TPA: hypothetical protein VGH13_03955 [Xanthobacteraceae bacterium]|jgi:cytochrome c
MKDWRNFRITLVLFFLLFASYFGLSYHFQNKAEQRLAHLTEGYLIYFSQCAYCHGAKLQGQWGSRADTKRTVAPGLNGADGLLWTKSDAELTTTIALHLHSDSPYAGTLSTGELLAVVIFIKEHWPRPKRAIQSFFNPLLRGFPWPNEQMWNSPIGCM